MEANELDLVETSDLIDALFRRCRDGVVLLSKDEKGDNMEAEGCIGSTSACLGLVEAQATRLRTIIQQEFLAEETEE